MTVARLGIDDQPAIPYEIWKSAILNGPQSSSVRSPQAEIALHLSSCTGQRGPLARARRASEVSSAQPSSSATAR